MEAVDQVIIEKFKFEDLSDESILNLMAFVGEDFDGGYLEERILGWGNITIRDWIHQEGGVYVKDWVGTTLVKPGMEIVKEGFLIQVITDISKGEQNEN